MNPALTKSMFDNRLLDYLDRHRRLVYTEHACRFARRRADPPRELRKVVGRMQRPDRVAPALFIDQIVPVGNHVVERAPRMAERHAAIHAARALCTDFRLVEILVDLEPIVDAFGWCAPQRQFTLEFKKSGRLTHVSLTVRNRLLARN